MSSPSPATRFGLIASVAALAVTGLAYANAFGVPFVWDDRAFVLHTPLVRELHAPSAYLGTAFLGEQQDPGAAPFYRPLVVFALALDHALWGANPAGFHLTNVLAHLVVCALVYALARRSGADAITAAVGAALFGSWPRLTESVTWISGRTDVLASLFVLAALAVHARTLADRAGGADAREPRDAGGGRASERRTIGASHWIAASLLFLGLLCKETAFAGVAAIALAELAAARRACAAQPILRALGRAAPALLALVAYGVLRGQVAGLGSVGAGLPPGERLLFAVQALGGYTLLLLDPLHPSLQIGLLGVRDAAQLALGLAAVGALLAIVAWTWARRRPPLEVALLALFVFGLAPVLHLIPLTGETLVSDRYLYLPVAALVIACAAAVSRTPLRIRRLACASGVLGVVVFAGATHARNTVWQSESRLWEHALQEADPRNPVPLAQLAEVRLRERRFEECSALYRDAAQRFVERSRTSGAGARSAVAPPPTIRLNTAICHAEAGEHGAAIAILEALVEAYPATAIYRHNLALNLARAMRFDDARRAIDALLAAGPGSVPARALQRELDAAAEIAARLPPNEGDAEPAETLALRALLHARLGIWTRSAHYAERVLDASDAGPAELHQAATLLVAFGTPDSARRAIARLEARPELAAEVRRLEAVLASR